MTVHDLTNALKARADGMPTIDASLKLDLRGEGIIHVDSKGDKNIITNDDKPADCTISMKLATFEKLRKGDLNPMMAVMTGKIKISGDMSLSMRLQELIK